MNTETTSDNVGVTNIEWLQMTDIILLNDCHVGIPKDMLRRCFCNMRCYRCITTQAGYKTRIVIDESKKGA